ncbi:energy-coupling factor ABC transporter permease [Halotia wernerae UHCC 0503]|nr:energy-coupling factor ABC transporter permease [Halotia wernerae UHCC 0503]
MHIELGVVDGAKIVLSYGTAVASLGYAGKLTLDAATRDGIGAVALRAAIAAAATFCFFEVLPHEPVGVSEVHLILGTTLYLLFGAAPAALGLALGLAAQSLFFAPADLPQYGMNVTTLLVPLFLLAELAKRVVPTGTAYTDIGYAQAFKLSAAYQGGVVAWVAFWVLYGHGFGAETLTEIASFGAAYMLVVLAEPLIDLGVLAAAKGLRVLRDTGVFQTRLYDPAT